MKMTEDLLPAIESIREYGIGILESCIFDLECMKNKNDSEDIKQKDEIIRIIKNKILKLREEND